VSHQGINLSKKLHRSLLPLGNRCNLLHYTRGATHEQSFGAGLLV
jgi:hypothetical protein